MQINYNTFISQFQSILGNDLTVNVSRAFTRLKSVFVSLDNTTVDWWRKQWNDFFSPMRPEQNMLYPVTNHNPDGEFQFQMQIGSKLFPEYPIRSHAEAFYQLKKTLGVQSSTLHNFNTTGQDYRDNRLVIGMDCEKV